MIDKMKNVLICLPYAEQVPPRDAGAPRSIQVMAQLLQNVDIQLRVIHMHTVAFQSKPARRDDTHLSLSEK